MSSYNVLKRQLDNYQDSMGKYNAAGKEFNSSVEEYNKYVTTTPYATTSSGNRSGGVRLSDGRSIGNSNISGEVSPGMFFTGYKPTEVTTKDGLAVVDKATFSSSTPMARPDESSLPKPIENPNLTVADKRKLQNPPATLASQASSGPGVLGKIKTANNISGSAYVGGMDSGLGVLQKAIMNKL